MSACEAANPQQQPLPANLTGPPAWAQGPQRDRLPPTPALEGQGLSDGPVLCSPAQLARQEGQPNSLLAPGNSDRQSQLMGSRPQMRAECAHAGERLYSPPNNESDGL